MTNKTTSQILQEARALVAAGWCQGPFHKLQGGQPCYCTAGAVLQAMGIAVPPGNRYFLGYAAVVHSPPMQALDRAAERLDGGVFGAVDYNEGEARTQAEVLALFDEALTDVTK